MNKNIPITLEYKPDFQRARSYWDAFWGHELIDRPCTSIFVNNSDEAVELDRCASVDADFEDVFRKADEYFESHSFLGEAMPGFRCGFGPDQIAGFLGAPLKMKEVTSWSEKIVDNWQDFLPLGIDENNLYWRRLKEFHTAAEDYYKGKCLLCDIDMHCNIDALEGLRGAQNLLFDIIDTPDIIHEAMHQIRNLYTKIYNEFYQYGDKKIFGTSNNLRLYSSGRYNRIQADFICLLDPKMFREFVLDAIAEEAEFVDHSCFHLDGKDALKHLDDILAIETLGAVQWVPGAGQKRQYLWPEVLHKIQDAGKAIVIDGSDIEEIKQHYKEYKPELVVFDLKIDSEKEGLDFLEWLEKNT